MSRTTGRTLTSPVSCPLSCTLRVSLHQNAVRLVGDALSCTLRVRVYTKMQQGSLVTHCQMLEAAPTAQGMVHSTRIFLFTVSVSVFDWPLVWPAIKLVRPATRCNPGLDDPPRDVSAKAEAACGWKISPPTTPIRTTAQQEHIKSTSRHH